MRTPDDSLRARLWRHVDEMVMDRAPIALTVHQLESRLFSRRIGGWRRHITRILKLEKLYVKALPAIAGGGGSHP
jgi:hypothetical protein